MKIVSIVCGMLLCIFSLLAVADTPPATVQILQKGWADIKYATPSDQREKAFAQLAEQAEAAVAAEPESAALIIWQGIILSSWAGEKGGLAALSLVKQAKANFEQALAIDPNALSGSAYTSLGALYYQVPGWPLGFGNDKKARQFLEQGLAVDPDGIDSNYFYGDFLAGKNEIEKARQVLQHALEAPARAQRPLADKGRKEEINQLLAKLES
jgi:tetratricopeptide (TPR) repeat protein